MGEHSIEEWFESYQKDITSFLAYYTGSLDVEDLVQETFLVAINKLSNFKGDSHPKTWLISIARNIVIDRYRRRKVWERIKHVISADETASNGIENKIIENLDSVELVNAIERLSRPHKEVVILRGILELSSEETCVILKCSQNTVNVKFHRALKKLRVILEKEGFSYER
ncbi:RNA polymerase sigma factor [Alkalihalobacillus sp. AL-G]|uniref:RNA polymerase sigma factor n=1 Tax=Alkalihalobacillus sp. AL-G TaxID=2926399 RepID=UPI00272B08D0|nr:RNA polymerase sigma factor [Alkalihalobacillus sp. AL-G]WLD93860.1 RNA polymerase sigma factor [Alkalihalobacillus sp. AL-G]